MENRQTRKAAWPALPLRSTHGEPPDAPGGAIKKRERTVIIITDEREAEKILDMLLPGCGDIPQ